MLRGINLSGLEFSPGQQRPRTESVSYFVSKGLQLFRIPFMWELIQPTIGGPLDPTIVGYLHSVISQIPSNAMVILDCHNYGRYNNKIIGQDPSAPTISDFGKLWYLVSTEFYGPNLIYGLMNEPHDQDDGWLVATLQAAIGRIRANHTNGWQNTILVPTNNWSNRWANKDGIPYPTCNLSDASNKLMLDVHIYLNQWSSGTDATIDPGWPSTVDTFITSCNSHSMPFIVGEIATGSDASSLAALKTLMVKLKSTPLCKGVCWWSGGGWAPTGYWASLDPVGNAWDSSTWAKPVDQPQLPIFLG